ncbi:MAG: DUF378 domain-containing protein [Patescibacteria group bacterium]
MSCNHGKCGCAKFAWILVAIGGLNWGLVGVGMLFGTSNWNVVNMLLGPWPVVEGIVYLLVGIATLVKIFGCPCKKCKEECMACKTDTASSPSSGQKSI